MSRTLKGAMSWLGVQKYSAPTAVRGEFLFAIESGGKCPGVWISLEGRSRKPERILALWVPVKCTPSR